MQLHWYLKTRAGYLAQNQFDDAKFERLTQLATQPFDGTNREFDQQIVANLTPSEVCQHTDIARHNGFAFYGTNPYISSQWAEKHDEGYDYEHPSLDSIKWMARVCYNSYLYYFNDEELKNPFTMDALQDSECDNVLLYRDFFYRNAIKGIKSNPQYLQPTMTQRVESIKSMMDTIVQKRVECKENPMDKYLDYFSQQMRNQTSSAPMI